jgi:hypothetical protein
MAIKLNPDYVTQFIANKSGELLTPYVDSRTKLDIRCLKHNCIWHPKWSCIRDGGWCPKCKSNATKSIEYIKDFVIKKGGIVLDSSSYINAKSKIQVQCLKHNHTWRTTWDYLNSERWCIKCSGIEPVTLNRVKTLILKKDGTFLSAPDKLTNTSKIKIQCNKDGHIWSPIYAALMKPNGSWCPLCSGTIVRPFKDVEALVTKRNGIILSSPDMLINAKSILQIRCSEGHEFERSYISLRNDGFCSQCKSFRSQVKLQDILVELLDCNAKPNYKGFEWLKNKRNLEIDLWFPDLKLAVEYDGVQHFKPTRYSNGQSEESMLKQFKGCQKRDRLKTRLIKKHPNEVAFFIRFNYKEKLTKDNVLRKLRKHGVIP